MIDDLTRRQAVGVAGFAGAMALAGLTPGVMAADRKAKPEFDEQTERKHVLACGFTEAEADCWIEVAKAAGKFFELPKLHPMDDQEVAQAIHIVQNKLLSRPVYRRYKGLHKGQKK
jgi:hypothetical protein